MIRYAILLAATVLVIGGCGDTTPPVKRASSQASPSTTVDDEPASWETEHYQTFTECRNHGGTTCETDFPKDAAAEKRAEAKAATPAPTEAPAAKPEKHYVNFDHCVEDPQSTIDECMERFPDPKPTSCEEFLEMPRADQAVLVRINVAKLAGRKPKPTELDLARIYCTADPRKGFLGALGEAVLG